MTKIISLIISGIVISLLVVAFVVQKNESNPHFGGPIVGQFIRQPTYTDGSIDWELPTTCQTHSYEIQATEYTEKNGDYWGGSNAVDCSSTETKTQVCRIGVSDHLISGRSYHMQSSASNCASGESYRSNILTFVR